ncbi:MAG TPA: hypothetical protein VMW62_16375 [Chloroflexota bacterium]|nr:hypothetical protein [Chloroflexota bacterium]
MTRQERSYLLPKLGAADRKLLAELPRKASLADEIAFLRLRILHLAGVPEIDTSLLVRMLTLLTRMVGVQAKLGNDSSDTLAELIEIVRQRLAEGATPEEAIR